jgi:hypothetical protein
MKIALPIGMLAPAEIIFAPDPLSAAVFTSPPRQQRLDLDWPQRLLATARTGRDV